MKVLYNLLKAKSPFAIIGLVFTCIAIFVLLPFLSLFAIVFSGENDSYNFKAIRKNGVEKNATITYIKTIENLTINDEHPIVISYEYDVDGKKVKDKFETLDLEQTANFAVGTNIKILTYKNQAIIKDVEPYSFPDYLFLLLPGLFFLIGIVLLSIGLIPALKIFKLYKTGIIKDATIISIESEFDFNSLKPNKGGIKVNYSFLDNQQNKIFGAYPASDFLFLFGKKEGDTIKIFVSEDDETKSCLVPIYEAAKYNWSI